MSKGFLVIAQNTDTVNYIEQAYALALSIKGTQKEVSKISIVTNDAVPAEYVDAFDKIIEIPWDDKAIDSNWKVENRWKLIYASPYDETMVLDTDMLLLEDISSWWDYCSNYDIKFCSNVKNHKLETIVNDTANRATFVENGLTNPYFALHYFKKTEESFRFYKMLEFISNNWSLCYGKFAPMHRQFWMSMDLSTAIAIEMLGLRETAVDVCSPLTFVHMKTQAQGWARSDAEKWTSLIAWDFNKDGQLYVGNIKQPAVFHYVDKQFITPKILSTLKELSNGI